MDGWDLIHVSGPPRPGVDLFAVRSNRDLREIAFSGTFDILVSELDITGRGSTPPSSNGARKIRRFSGGEDGSDGGHPACDVAMSKLIRRSVLS